MKITANKIKDNNFKPINLSITIETQEELNNIILLSGLRTIPKTIEEVYTTSQVDEEIIREFLHKLYSYLVSV